MVPSSRTLPAFLHSPPYFLHTLTFSLLHSLRLFKVAHMRGGCCSAPSFPSQPAVAAADVSAAGGLRSECCCAISICGDGSLANKYLSRIMRCERNHETTRISRIRQRGDGGSDGGGGPWRRALAAQVRARCERGAGRRVCAAAQGQDAGATRCPLMAHASLRPSRPSLRRGAVPSCRRAVVPALMRGRGLRGAMTRYRHDKQFNINSCGRGLRGALPPGCAAASGVTQLSAAFQACITAHHPPPRPTPSTAPRQASPPQRHPRLPPP